MYWSWGSAAVSVLRWLVGLFFPSRTSATITVKKLFIYPVKSCGGVSVECARLVETGFEFDRQWVVVDAKTNKFITQRQHPKMALIQPELTEIDLILRAPGREEPLVIPLDRLDEPERVTVTIWKDQVGGIDEGDDAAAWLSEFFERSVRLVRKDSDRPRTLNADCVNHEEYTYQTQTGFADKFPLLIVSSASVQEVHDRVKAVDTLADISDRNFRPTIVVQTSTPFVEDSWHKILIGEDVVVRIVALCSRCTIPDVDPDTGKMAWPTLKTIMKYRRVDPRQPLKACVGVHAVHLTPGSVVSVGDKISVIQNRTY